MRLPVFGDETCTVHREDDIFMQKVDVMDDLVVAALQEGRINADHRQHPLAGQTSCKGHGMLFGHADIEEALRMGMTEKLQTCAVFHGGSNGTEGLVGVSGGAERPAKGTRERLCRSDLGVGDAGRVEPGNAMVIAGVRLSRRIALALFRHDMEQRRPGLSTNGLENALQFRLVVAVDEAKIVKTHILEHRGMAHGPADRFFAVLKSAFDGRSDDRHTVQEAADIFLGRKIAVRGAQMAQIACQRTDIVGNGHFIVVEDDQKIVQLSDIVHSLVDHAAGECTVADDGHHMARLPFQLFGPCDADGNRKGRIAVSGDKSIMGALIGIRKARKAVQLPQGAKALIPPGQELMGVALMSYVKHESVLRSLKDTVKCYRQLDRTEIGSKMTACFGYAVQQKLTDLAAELLDLRAAQALQVTRL